MVVKACRILGALVLFKTKFLPNLALQFQAAAQHVQQLGLGQQKPAPLRQQQHGEQFPPCPTPSARDRKDILHTGCCSSVLVKCKKAEKEQLHAHN